MRCVSHEKHRTVSKKTLSKCTSLQSRGQEEGIAPLHHVVRVTYVRLPGGRLQDKIWVRVNGQGVLPGETSQGRERQAEEAERPPARGYRQSLLSVFKGTLALEPVPSLDKAAELRVRSSAVTG